MKKEEEEMGSDLVFGKMEVLQQADEAGRGCNRLARDVREDGRHGRVLAQRLPASAVGVQELNVSATWQDGKVTW
jgi:hypothetical protein